MGCIISYYKKGKKDNKDHLKIPLELVSYYKDTNELK